MSIRHSLVDPRSTEPTTPLPPSTRGIPEVRAFILAVAAVLPAGCGDGSGGAPVADAGPSGDVDLPPASCAPAGDGGAASPAAPELSAALSDRWHEGWLASPAVADLDGDGVREILAARGGLVLGWHLDGEIVFRAETKGGRIWASPIVTDFVSGNPGLEVAVASRESVYLFDSSGAALPGFPTSFRDELRSLAASDLDGDGALELVAVSTTRLESNGQRDIVTAFHTNGEVVSGFPPNTTGASGCDDRCYVTGGFDQNVAVGDVDGDGLPEIFVGQDNAYLSLHDGTGRAFDAAPIFEHPTKFLGVRFLHDYALAQQGWAEDEERALQAHFTNSAPAIADIDGDGRRELVVLGSVQNAAQTDRFKGVGLWVLREDGTRHPDWLEPYHAPDYLAGLWDYEGTNVVGATNQVSVADIDASHPGRELLFAGFDGAIHCVSASREQIWRTVYTTDERVLTAGLAVADLSGDGVAEIIFATYSPDNDKSALVILNAAGVEEHKVALPGRGAMAVPTLADVEGDGQLDIVVALKGGEDKEPMVLVYSVPGAGESCLLWPTGRGNVLRSGLVN